jgi:hypothetical protein
MEAEANSFASALLMRAADILKAHLSHLGYSLPELAKLVRIHEYQFTEMYGGTASESPAEETEAENRRLNILLDAKQAGRTIRYSPAYLHRYDLNARFPGRSAQQNRDFQGRRRF